MNGSNDTENIPSYSNLNFHALKSGGCGWFVVILQRNGLSTDDFQPSTCRNSLDGTHEYTLKRDTT